MKILITAGGTSERIDDVRRISNNSTGRLGAEIARVCSPAHEIFYVRGKGAVSPDLPGINEFIIEDAASLEATLREILAKHDIDAIIHAMAVSDFRVKDEICGKISSDVDEITLTLAKVPKIIGMLRELVPKAVLVGFKLVSGLGEDALVDAGYDLLLRYNCDYVLANDAAQLDPVSHKGWLIQKDKSFKIFTGKEEIANGIKEGVEKIWKI